MANSSILAFLVAAGSIALCNANANVLFGQGLNKSADVLSVMADSLVSEGKSLYEPYVYYPRLGNFSNGCPWRSPCRPFPIPQDPAIVGTKIHFFSRKNSENGTKVILDPKVVLNDTNFDKNKKTYIICPGYIAPGDSNWMLELKVALLIIEDCNVFLVDWSKGSQQIDVFQAASDARIVAAEIKVMIEALNIDCQQTHYIGHSLGAHIGGELGRMLRLVNKLLGRITGLDPAGQFFEGCGAETHLDVTDANFVDVLHTDGKPFELTGLGFIFPMGHVDFFINGGYEQPGCLLEGIEVDDIRRLFEGQKIHLSDTTLCNHGRAVKYFVEAVKNLNCTFWGREYTAEAMKESIVNNAAVGYEADKFESQKSACNLTTCAPVGLDTPKSPKRGSFIVLTHGIAEFCVKSSNNGPKTDETCYW